MTNPPNETPQSNRPEDALDQHISDAQRGITSGDELIDMLASLQPAPDADFQKRLEIDLIQHVSKASANGANHIPDKPITLTRGELNMYPEKNKNRAQSRLSWIAGIAAALMLVFVGGMWIGSGANVPAFLAPQADNTPQQAPVNVVTATPMLLPPTVFSPTATPMPSPTFTSTFVPTVTAPSFPPTSLDFTATPVPTSVSIPLEVSGFTALIDIEPGTVIDLSMLHQQAFPSGLVPGDASLTADDLIGRTAAVQIFEDQVIIERMLEPDDNPYIATSSCQIVSHRVSEGETLTSIAMNYSQSYDTLLRANNLNDDQSLVLGEKLAIPVGDCVFASLTPGVSNVIVYTGPEEANSVNGQWLPDQDMSLVVIVNQYEDWLEFVDYSVPFRRNGSILTGWVKLDQLRIMGDLSAVPIYDPLNPSS